MPAVDWQADPTGRHQTRRRNPDGTWSDQVADSGVFSSDPYDGEQPEPIPASEPEPEPEPEPGTHPANVPPPRSTQMPAAGREPLGFWQTTLAVAVGVLIAAAVGLFVLSMLVGLALEEVL